MQKILEMDIKNSIIVLLMASLLASNIDLFKYIPQKIFEILIPISYDKKFLSLERNLYEFVRDGHADNGFIVVFNNFKKDDFKQVGLDNNNKFNAEAILITKDEIKRINNVTIFDKNMDYVVLNSCYMNDIVEQEREISEKEIGKKITKILIQCPLFIDDNLLGFYGISKYVNIFEIERLVSKFSEINNNINKKY